MKNKLFTLLLAVAASVGTMFALDYERVQIGNLYYNLDATNQTAEVTYKSLDSYNIIYNKGWGITTANIPTSVEYNSVTYSVTSIGSYAFCECTSLTSVTIPNSVTSIGNYAFAYCSGLTSVTIPNSVTSIGSYAFYDCSGLTSPVYNAHIFAFMPTIYSGAYTIPDGIESIAGGAFSGCSGLTSVTIGNSVTSIGSYAFYECSGLTSPVYNAHVFAFMPTIYSGAYTIPDGIESIAGGAFYGCSGLTFVTIPNSVTSIGVLAFRSCSGLTSVTIGNSVTSIGDYAFYECRGLTSVTIGNSVTSIGDEAFYGCNINAINFIGNIEDWLNKAWSPFGSNYRLQLNGVLQEDIVIPENISCIGNSAFSGCSGLTSVTIPNSVTSIGGSAFRQCTGLTSVTIPNSVTSIGRLAFSGCTGLTSVTIGNSITSIGEAAFWGCRGLTSPIYNAHVFAFMPTSYSGAYSIPDDIESIAGGAFRDCRGLTSVTIPNSVTSIGYQAFEGCTGLPVIDNCRYADTYLVEAVDKTLSTYSIKDKTQWIGSKAFYKCRSLTSIDIPNSVTSIGYMAFQECGLTSVTIPNSIKIIDEYAFFQCNLSLINFLGSIEDWCNIKLSYASTSSYYDLQLNGITQKDITIPNNITKIGYWTFAFCGGLTSATIPNSVTSISEWAFRYCTNLTSITMEAETPPTLGADAFDDTNDCPIYVPCGTLDAYKSALRNYESRVKYEPLKFTITGNVNIESAGVVLLPQNNCESTIITAQPDTGYYFVQWSDGVTDNPRTIELTQDTILTALFDSIPAGQDTTATEIKNDSVMVSATPTEDNSVILEWPAVEGADTYTITIYKNDELICTLVFDAEGHLISIRFAAPARDGNGRNIPVAEQAANGWRYVVTGMQPNTTYAYSVVAKDENGNVLLSESIDFTMPEPLSVDNIDSSSLQGGDRGRLILHNGQILILRGDKTYTLTGVEVK